MQSYVQPVDRTTNIVITGVAEDRDRNVWRNKVCEVLRKSAGRDIDIVDAFRLCGQFNARRTRPILMKLHSVWDRRIVLGGSRHLAEVDDLKHIYVSADEPLEPIRRARMDRLKKKADREGKTTFIVDDILLINDVAVFSVKDGFVSRSVQQCATGDGYSSSLNDGSRS